MNIEHRTFNFERRNRGIQVGAIGVGGVDLVLWSDEGVSVEHDRAKVSFAACASPDVETLNIRLCVQPEQMPVTADMKKVFDCGEGWTMFAENGHRHVVLQPPSFREPLWCASMDHECDEITVHCGQRLVRRDGNSVMVHNPVTYPLDQILMMFFLARNQGVIVHAAGVEMEGKGLIFAGCSGAGKSTLSRLLMNEPGMRVLSDDRIIVRKKRDGFKMHGTPWHGDAGLAENRSVDLKGVFFLKHGVMNEVCQLSHTVAFERLLTVASVPWFERVVTDHILSVCENVAKEIPAYEFAFVPDAGAAEFVQRMGGGAFSAGRET